MRYEQSIDDRLWINAAILFLQEFRKVNPDVTANTILTFLHIAKQPGITQKEILQLLGLADSGQSRTVSTLSKYGDRGRAGWNVVDLEEDPRDRRQKPLRLNGKEELILASLRRLFPQ
ncbi:helix-turn-helix domain-containing protein [Methylocapsa sp. D3K7]|uniref:MarR family transcriptional regulator n=1 Tax=Methylocapsa sp. D3K7 TaxID=3041435 RepID=UPI00244EC0FA|nr:helix-turn-helix domain-containing protein [Methylocapsa sp. D3K7]WGJ14593.1 helix-turn-helix domain-containing protein [Methylocapsa sp. D3K7]